jgi:hypothetical protein
MIAKKQIQFTGTLGTNTPNIDENHLAEMLFILETEFNKNPYGRLHISISEELEAPTAEAPTAEVSLSAVKDDPETTMEIGDLVKSKDLTIERLACGTGIYDNAMIYSLEPFGLISEDGDMIWQKMNRNDFWVYGKADFKTIRKAMLRLANDCCIDIHEYLGFLRFYQLSECVQAEFMKGL